MCGAGDAQCCNACNSSVFYCSEACQLVDWPSHAVLCNSICQLEKLEKDKLYGDKSVRQCQIDDKTRRKVVKLVGDKPKIRCFLNDREVELLWDTGSMVSLVDRCWVQKWFPSQEIFPVSKFLDGQSLKLSAANSSEIKFDGVVLLDFGLTEGEVKFSIPVLVSSSKLAQPILGYNVIKCLVLEGNSMDHEQLTKCFQTFRPVMVEPLVSVIQEEAANPDFIAEIKTPEDVIVPAGRQQLVRCRIKANPGGVDDQDVYFEPKLTLEEDLTFLETVSQLRRGRTNFVYVEVLNETGVEKVLRKGSVLGSVHSVSAVVPMLKFCDAAVGHVDGQVGFQDGERNVPAGVPVGESDAVSATTRYKNASLPAGVPVGESDAVSATTRYKNATSPVSANIRYKNATSPVSANIRYKNATVPGVPVDVPADAPAGEGRPVEVPVDVTGVAEVPVVSDDWVPVVNLCHLDPEQQSAVMAVLIEEKDVFSRSECDIGNVTDFQMKINLGDDVPVREAYRKIPRNLYAEVRNYINDLLTNGWIRESYSSYSSPIVCVRKKDGGLRMCCDYRKLNGKTVADSQPIPRIQDILDGLAGKQYFSTLDMSKAYHQGYIEEDSRHLTAFATPWTLYEWIRIPFGLRNAPPAFQRFMNGVLGEFKGAICDPYLDDVLCYSETFAEGLSNLQKILRRLREKGIKLRADKCEFLKKEVRYLGRLVSGEGFRMDPKDTEALERFREPPTNVGELRSLLGLFGYYRCYVKDFARRVKPLYDLLKSDENNGKAKAKSGCKPGQKYDSKDKIKWTEELQKSWMDLWVVVSCCPGVAGFRGIKFLL